MKLKILLLGLVVTITFGFWGMFEQGNFHDFMGYRDIKPRIPKRLTLKDYQTLDDSSMMHWLSIMDESGACRELDSGLIKPVFDDANTKLLVVESIEVNPSQYPQLDKAVRACAAILRVPKPRVFVSQHANVPITLENYINPVSVVQASALHQFQTPSELRFLVGREMGHIAAGHGRWISLIQQTSPVVEKSGVIGRALVSTFQDTLSRWVWQCQETSDRAGLICSQDIHSCERVLVKLATGFGDDEMSDVNIEEYLSQLSPAESNASISRLSFLWTPVSVADSIPGRILSLREYEKSATYAEIWN